MFDTLERLAAEVDDLDLVPDAATLTTVLAIADRLNAKIAVAAGAFDADAGWAPDGATSLTAWLRLHGKLSNGAAVGMARTAERVHDVPRLAALWQAGTLRSGHIAAVVANVPDHHAGLFAEQADELIDLLAGLTPTEAHTALRHWRNNADDQRDKPPAPARPSELCHSETFRGRWETKASFDAHDGSIIAAAINAALTGDADGEDRTHTRRRADALVDIATFYLDHHQQGLSRRNRPHVNVVIDLRALGNGLGGHVADTGSPLSSTVVRTLLCDCELHRVLVDGDSEILDLGRAQRLASDAQWQALIIRDQHCRHPGCDRPPQFCDAHHVIEWPDGGPTDLDNLVLKCKRHHRLAHQRGWHEALEPDGTLHLTDPLGRTWTTQPRGINPLRPRRAA